MITINAQTVNIFNQQDKSPGVQTQGLNKDITGGAGLAGSDDQRIVLLAERQVSVDTELKDIREMLKGMQIVKETGKLPKCACGKDATIFNAVDPIGIINQITGETMRDNFCQECYNKRAK